MRLYSVSFPHSGGMGEDPGNEAVLSHFQTLVAWMEILGMRLYSVSFPGSGGMGEDPGNEAYSVSFPDSLNTYHTKRQRCANILVREITCVSSKVQQDFGVNPFLLSSNKIPFHLIPCRKDGRGSASLPSFKKGRQSEAFSST